jgi:hypothetical protein
MKNKFKSVTILLALLFTISFTAAAPSNLDTTGQEKTNNIDNVQVEETNVLERFFENALNFLSVSAIEDDVAPGETQTFSTENTLNSQVQASDLDFNIDVIYCGTECTDPPTGSCAEIGDVPEGEEDCIAHNVIDYNEVFEGDLGSQPAGSTFSTVFDYTIPENAPEGTYLVQSFLYDRGSDSTVSDFSNDYFTVSTEDDGTDPGDGTDSDDPSVDEPVIETYRSPDVVVDGDTVTGTVYLENNGGDMTASNIVEMQIKTPENEFFSWVGGQSTCDPEHPATVNKPFKLGSGERTSVTLTSSNLPDGQYDVVFVTATGCTVNGDGELVEPYSSWRDNYRETVNVGNGDGDDDGIPLVPVVAGIVGIGILGVIVYREL